MPSQRLAMAARWYTSMAGRRMITGAESKQKGIHVLSRYLGNAEGERLIALVKGNALIAQGQAFRESFPQRRDVLTSGFP